MSAWGRGWQSNCDADRNVEADADVGADNANDADIPWVKSGSSGVVVAILCKLPKVNVAVLMTMIVMIVEIIIFMRMLMVILSLNGDMYHNHNLHGDMMRNLDFGDGVARPGAAKSEKRDKGWKLRESRS